MTAWNAREKSQGHAGPLGRADTGDISSISEPAAYLFLEVSARWPVRGIFFFLSLSDAESLFHVDHITRVFYFS